MNTRHYIPFVIFSVYRSSRNEETNARAELNVEYILRHSGASYKRVNGCYKGESEPSLLVHARHLPLVVQLAACWDQESILIVSKHREAHLLYLDDGREESLGYFLKATPGQLAKAESYTYDPHTNTAYVCVGG